MNAHPSTLRHDFAADAAVLQPELVALRRELHAHPEVGMHLPVTQAAVLRRLEGLDLEITRGRAGSSLTVVLRGGSPGPAVLLRGDMDALPVAEHTGLDYAATNGAMHACGHDLHTAGLVGAVRLLHARRAELPGDVVFMFQPGEEGPGGAGPMIDEGLLEAAGKPLVAAYGIHVVPGPRGIFTTRPGTIMAGSNILEIRVTGKGGHGSNPSKSIDPVPVLLEIAGALQTFASRRFTAADPIVLSVTQLAAGSEAVNVIPDTATLGATIRTLSQASFDLVATELPRMVQTIARAHNCSADVDFTLLYPPTVNAPEHAKRALETLGAVFGSDRAVPMPDPMMGSEDFSLVLERVPGAFIMLMATPPDLDPATAAYNHSPEVRFDDAVLGDQAAALAHLAWSALRASAAQ
jgi:amidohydrolase